jgi:hypothetical protein
VLEQMGLSVDSLQGGCCGLAGSWGFEGGKYDISMDCGEQALLPAVRQAAPDTLIVADGFSCQTQIADSGTGRRAVHLAEVMQSARQGRSSAEGPDSAIPRPPAARRVTRVAAAVLPAVAALGATAAAVTRRSVRARASR